MKINKLFNSVNDVMSDVFDGAVIMLGGFGEAGSPVELIHGLIDTKCKDLTIIANNAGNGKIGLGALIGENQVKKLYVLLRDHLRVLLSKNYMKITKLN